MTFQNRGVYPTYVDVTDEIEINTTAAKAFEVIQDYPSINSWYDNAQCEYLNGATATVPGTEVKHRYGKLIPMSQFVRHIDKVEPGVRIEESYIRGDLLGRGIWTFEDLSDDPAKPRCRVAYLCQVDSSKTFMQVIFKFMGNYGHSSMYKQLLASLKKHCESIA